MSSNLKESYRPSIHGSNFITNTTYQTTRLTGKLIEETFLAVETKAHCKGFERLIEAVSPNAFYDSDNRADPPMCHPNTRVAVINKIIGWANGMIDTDACFLWLYGPAGAGKTAIARKVAEFFAEHRLLLASFLFFRSDPKRNTMTPLVANIAYSVACAIPGAREPIDAAIEADPLIFSYSLDVQFTKLFFEPLRLLVDQGHFLDRQLPRLVVIDGLDECLDKTAQANLIRFLSSSMDRYHLQLTFLIISRPEAHITSAVTLASEQSTFSRLELNNDFRPDEDIHRFLTDKFVEIKICHHFHAHIPFSWPSEKQLQTLVRKASGQFIYASLAMRFVNSACDSPMRQLDIVLGLRPPISPDLPFAELDALYRYILSCTKNIDLALHIIALDDILWEDLDKDIFKGIEAILGLEDGDVHIHLSPLSSLLDVRKNSINFYHSSFMDFLRTPERSADYHIDAQKNRSLVVQYMLGVFTRNGRCSLFLVNWY